MTDLLSTPSTVPGGVADTGAADATALSTAGQGLTTKPLSPSRLAWLRFRRHKLAMLSFVVLVLFTFLIFFPDLVTKWGPLERDLEAPQFAGPSAEHWFGTDDIRQDIFSRVLHGGHDGGARPIGPARRLRIRGPAAGECTGK